MKCSVCEKMIRNVLRVLDNVTYVNIVFQIIRITKFFHEFCQRIFASSIKIHLRKRLERHISHNQERSILNSAAGKNYICWQRAKYNLATAIC